MRLEKEKIDFLKKKIAEQCDQYKLFLFGSRIDMQSKGGDIDLLLLSDPQPSRTGLRQIKIDFQREFGEQKLDLLSYPFDSQDPFKLLAEEEGVEL